MKQKREQIKSELPYKDALGENDKPEQSRSK